MTYTIKEFAQKVNLSAPTLRYYEKEGLLPASKRLNNSHRIYNDSDIPWVTLISCLRSTGMSVSDLKHYVKLCEQGDKTVQERKQIILHQKQKIEMQLQEIKKHLELINLKLNMYDDIISKQVPPREAVSSR
ncbi:MAG: MerR family transcriptional regulator [Candidatus Babeliaceae bacterium]|nr:MerR family transcriptional regulator [Candidatus Babeliaceae bacterium]